MQSSKERCSYCQSLSAFVIQSAVLYWLLSNAQCFTYAPVSLFFKERRDFILQHHQHLYVSITIYLSIYLLLCPTPYTIFCHALQLNVCLLLASTVRQKILLFSEKSPKFSQ